MAALTGGDKLMAALDAIDKRLAAAGSAPKVSVGFLEGSTYPDGKSIPMIAAVQEFGSPKKGIPPRPFFRTMIRQKAPAWGGSMATLLKRTDYNALKTLGLMGEVIKGQLQQSIHDLTSPPLKPATIRAKGFSKPLIGGAHDSGGGGVMWNSVDYHVDAT